MHTITHQLSIEDIKSIIQKNDQLKLSSTCEKKIAACRKYLDRKLETANHSIYGINTGFGSLYNQSINTDDIEQLQYNLIRSHACGTGELAPREIVKLMLLLKVQGLSYGNSGVQLETVQLLIEFYNKDILPVVYTQGSLGASGDLAPLAHLCLPLIGEGEVVYRGKKMKATAALKSAGLKAIRLQSKEGLALLNGTQFMSAYSVYAAIQAKNILQWSCAIAAVSLDAFDGRIEPFHPSIQKIRSHAGQISIAASISKLLKGSALIKRAKTHVQDPYSFRCIPQVHGASYDAIQYCLSVFEKEINSVTDNPTIFPDDDLIISAGNFHGQPLALSLDYLAIALSELGNISERRTYQLISGQRGLPAFLVSKPGLNSGYMIPQYTAASIVSANKQLCMPASVDSIVSSNGQEDHVSMGANAAVKCLRVVENVYTILAIELLNAAQAMEFRRPLKTSEALEKLLTVFRKVVKPYHTDRIMYPDMHAATSFVKQTCTIA